MKKQLIMLALASTALLVTPKVVLADQTCTSVYGGGVVCGAETHKAVETGLADVNPALLGGAFSVVSGVLFRLSQKVKKSSDAL